MRILMLALGVIMAAWSGAGVLLMTVYNGDLNAEETFCSKLAVCDPVRRVEHARTYPNVQDYTVLVKRDPHFPFEWADLADAYAKAGRNEEASIAFGHAVATSPRWPPVLIRAVEFYFQNDNWKAALPLATDILDQVPVYDARIFRYYSKIKPLSEVFAKGFPDGNPRPVRSWLGYIIAYGTWPDVQETWRWATSRGLINVATAASYVTWLLLNHPAEAPKVWSEYAGIWAEEGYLKTNYIFNGGFEKGFTGCLMDWTFLPTKGVDAKVIDRADPAQGEWAMRLRFDGQHNVAFTGLRQDVVLSPGRYRLKARVRTEGITTDEGVQLRLSQEAASEKFVGTRPWTVVDIPFTAAQLKVYSLQVIRTPSFRFGNKVEGTFWLDDVRIEPAL